MMKGALENITQAVGHTPIVKLNKVTAGGRRATSTSSAST